MSKISLKESLRLHRKYFSEYSSEIAVRNLKLMRTVCWAGILLYLLYFAFTVLFFSSKLIPPYYALILPILGLFLLQIHRDLSSGNATFPKTQFLTIGMYLIVMGFTIVMSVFAHPELNAVYYPLFLILGPVMFILPIHNQFFINIASYAVFSYLVVHVKAEELWMHDLFESFTALGFSVVAILLMTQFHVQSDELKSKYYSLSRLDGLTGLLNKTTGSGMIQDYVENALTKDTFAMILLDIDSFKAINDTYGHECGDMVLKNFGRILSSTFRKDDILSRYGGDEFLILMKKASEQNCADKLIALEKQLGDAKMFRNISVSISAGAVTGRCGKERFAELLNHADEALYEVKHRGKNNHCFYRRTKQPV